MDKAIVVKDLKFRYLEAKDWALKGVSLEIDPGEFVLLTGPTAAGKTTLCLTLNGLIPSVVKGTVRGSVTVRGMDTRESERSAVIREVGMMLQDPESQFIGGSVEEEVAFGLENLCMPREEMLRRIEYSLKRVRMEQFRKRFCRALSGGQKQRTVLAFALSLDTGILVLDEPTAELDPLGRREVFSVLNRIAKEGKRTVFLVTHHIDQVVEYASRMVVLYDGEVIADGDPREIITSRTDEMLRYGVRIPEVSELTLRINSEHTLARDLPVPLTLEEAEDTYAAGLRGKTLSVQPVGREVEAGDVGRTPVIAFEGVSFRYGEAAQPAVKDIDLSIFEGESVGIIGQNGSGKTTLARLCNGLLKPSEGKVLLYGSDSRDLSISETSRRVGYVFQNPDHQLISGTVVDELRFGLRNIGTEESEIEERIGEVSRLFELESHMERYPLAMSKGLKQKVALASVFAMDPAVLIVDEPTTGLDWRETMASMRECRRISEVGKTLIMITHDMRLVAELAHRVIMMFEGQIMFDGTVDEAFEQVELLETLFLSPPQITQFAHRLRGPLDLPLRFLTVDEAAARLGSAV
jgi:energy-coupling factor transporter ATP-binding protein EcfA2